MSVSVPQPPAKGRPFGMAPIEYVRQCLIARRLRRDEESGLYSFDCPLEHADDCAGDRVHIMVWPSGAIEFVSDDDCRHDLIAKELQFRRRDLQPDKSQRPIATMSDAEAPTTSKKSRFRLLSGVELGQLKEPPSLINGLFSRGSLVSLVGPWKSFKSFVALDWVMCIGTGTPWCKRDVHQGPALYIYAEGAGGLGKRFSAWTEAHEIKGEPPVYFVPERVPMSDPAAIAELLSLIGEKLPAPPVVIVVDTLNRNFQGDENSQQDMTAFVQGCDRLKEATGAAVIVVHHFGHGGERGRGSSVLPAAVDTEFSITRDEFRITLKNTLQKDIPEFPETTLELFPIGESLVVFSGTSAGEGPTASEAKGLKVLRALGPEVGLTTTEWETQSELTHGTFFRAKASLVAKGYVQQKGKLHHITASGILVLGTRGTKQVPTLPPLEVPRSHTPKGVGPVGLGRDSEPESELDRAIWSNKNVRHVAGGTIGDATSLRLPT